MEQKTVRKSRKTTSPYESMSLKELLTKRAELQKSIDEIDELLKEAAAVLNKHGVIGSSNVMSPKGLVNSNNYNDDPTRMTVPAPPPPPIDNVVANKPVAFDPSLASGGDITPLVGILDPSVEELHQQISESLESIQGIQPMST